MSIPLPYKEMTPIQKMFINLCLKDKGGKAKCIWCNNKFSDGIMRENGPVNVPLDAYAWFKADFLIHAQTTHGFSPEAITDMLTTLSTGKGGCNSSCGCEELNARIKTREQHANTN